MSEVPWRVRRASGERGTFAPQLNGTRGGPAETTVA